MFLGLFSATVLASQLAFSADPKPSTVVSDISYKVGAELTDYEKERCRLDLYVPENADGKVPALVWFHGGGLKDGRKDDEFTAKICQALARQGLAVVAVNYRLSPKAKYPAYLEDGAAAFAWVYKHAVEYGIDPPRIFIGGHSAGGYLTTMLGIDPRWLGAQGLKPDAIAGLIPISGQMMTHYTVREERGIKDRATVIADDAAPIYHVRKDTPPWLILYADHDMPTRAEENRYFVSALEAVENPHVTERQIQNRTHGSIAEKIAEPGDPAAEAILSFVASTAEKKTPASP